MRKIMRKNFLKKFLKNRKIKIAFWGIGLLASFMQSSFLVATGMVEKSLILTGDLYSFVNNDNAEYLFQIDSVEKLKSLGNKTLGFKIKQETIKGDSVEVKEEVTGVLGVRTDSEKESSLEIYNNIQKMLLPSADGKTLTFALTGGQAEEGYSQLASLLEGKYKNKKESFVVEYFDNRTDGDSTTTVKVLYRFGKKESGFSSSGFVMLDAELQKSSDSVSDSKSSVSKSQSNLEQINVLSSIDVSKILSALKDQSSVVVKIRDNQENIIPRNLFSGLMYDKYKNKEIIFEKYSNGVLLYIWTVPVSNIHDIKNFDIGISTTNLLVNEFIDKLEDKYVGRINNYRVISFGEKDVLPVTCKVEIAVDLTGFDLSKMKVFSVDLDKKALEEKSVNCEVKDNMVSMTIGFGGNYIIAN